MTGAGEVLAMAAKIRIDGIDALTGVYVGNPIQAVPPFATLDAGLETDWSHKTGVGRDVRLSITLRDKGEQQGRLHRLMNETEIQMAGIDAEADGWRIVSLAFLRSRVVSGPGEGWSGILEYRARMLALPSG